MKSEPEVQRALELTAASISNGRSESPEIESIFNSMMAICRDVLCWVLEHNHETAFAKNLLEIEAGMFGAGLKIENGELKRIFD